MNKMKNTKAITLIALVITIIVLLILAGVSIAMLTGENSILGRATQASATNQIGAAQDAVSLYVADKVAEFYDEAYVKGETGTLTGGLNAYLKTAVKKTEVQTEIGNDKITLKIDSDNFTAQNGGVVFKLYVEDNTADYKSEGTVVNGKVSWKLSKGEKDEYKTEREVADEEEDDPVASLPTGAGTKPYLPTGFRQVEGTNLSTGSTGGLVITDAAVNETNGNEYVWVEVPNANLEEKAEDKPTYGPDYSTQGLTVSEITDATIDANKSKIEAALWAYTGTLISRTETNDAKTTYRGWKDEWYDGTGKNASSSSNTGDDTGCGLTETAYNTLYKNMLKSVYNHGGFWIGRYEAGIERTEGMTEEQYLALARQQNSDRISSSSPKAVSKIDHLPYNWVYCREAQSLAKEAGANLMFGIQWDLTLRYLQATGAVDQDGLRKNSEGWGNYDYEYALNQTTVHGYKGMYAPWRGGDYSTKLEWTLIESGYSHKKNFYQGSLETEVPYYALSTGATERNAKKNINDLAGNMDEWTLEHATSGSGSPCATRGGVFLNTGSTYPASYRSYSSTSISSFDLRL